MRSRYEISDYSLKNLFKQFGHTLHYYTITTLLHNSIYIGFNLNCFSRYRIVICLEILNYTIITLYNHWRSSNSNYILVGKLKSKEEYIRSGKKKRSSYEFLLVTALEIPSGAGKAPRSGTDIRLKTHHESLFIYLKYIFKE